MADLLIQRIFKAENSQKLGENVAQELFYQNASYEQISLVAVRIIAQNNEAKVRSFWLGLSKKIYWNLDAILGQSEGYDLIPIIQWLFSFVGKHITTCPYLVLGLADIISLLFRKLPYTVFLGDHEESEKLPVKLSQYFGFLSAIGALFSCVSAIIDAESALFVNDPDYLSVYQVICAFCSANFFARYSLYLDQSSEFSLKASKLEASYVRKCNSGEIPGPLGPTLVLCSVFIKILQPDKATHSMADISSFLVKYLGIRKVTVGSGTTKYLSLAIARWKTTFFSWQGGLVDKSIDPCLVARDLIFMDQAFSSVSEIEITPREIKAIPQSSLEMSPLVPAMIEKIVVGVHVPVYCRILIIRNMFSVYKPLEFVSLLSSDDQQPVIESLFNLFLRDLTLLLDLMTDAPQQCKYISSNLGSIFDQFHQGTGVSLEFIVNMVTNDTWSLMGKDSRNVDFQALEVFARYLGQVPFVSEDRFFWQVRFTIAVQSAQIIAYFLTTLVNKDMLFIRYLEMLDLIAAEPALFDFVASAGKILKSMELKPVFGVPFAVQKETLAKAVSYVSEAPLLRCLVKVFETTGSSNSSIDPPPAKRLKRSVDFNMADLSVVAVDNTSSIAYISSLADGLHEYIQEERLKGPQLEAFFAFYVKNAYPRAKPLVFDHVLFVFLSRFPEYRNLVFSLMISGMKKSEYNEECAPFSVFPPKNTEISEIPFDLLHDLFTACNRVYSQNMPVNQGVILSWIHKIPRSIELLEAFAVSVVDFLQKHEGKVPDQCISLWRACFSEPHTFEPLVAHIFLKNSAIESQVIAKKIPSIIGFFFKGASAKILGRFLGVFCRMKVNEGNEAHEKSLIDLRKRALIPWIVEATEAMAEKEPDDRFRAHLVLDHLITKSLAENLDPDALQTLCLRLRLLSSSQIAHLFELIKSSLANANSEVFIASLIPIFSCLSPEIQSHVKSLIAQNLGSFKPGKNVAIVKAIAETCIDGDFEAYEFIRSTCDPENAAFIEERILRIVTTRFTAIGDATAFVEGTKQLQGLLDSKSSFSELLGSQSTMFLKFTEMLDDLQSATMYLAALRILRKALELRKNQDVASSLFPVLLHKIVQLQVRQVASPTWTETYDLIMFIAGSFQVNWPYFDFSSVSDKKKIHLLTIFIEIIKSGHTSEGGLSHLISCFCVMLSSLSNEQITQVFREFLIAGASSQDIFKVLLSIKAQPDVLVQLLSLYIDKYPLSRAQLDSWIPSPETLKESTKGQRALLNKLLVLSE